MISTFDELLSQNRCYNRSEFLKNSQRETLTALSSVHCHKCQVSRCDFDFPSASEAHYMFATKADIGVISDGQYKRIPAVVVRVELVALETLESQVPGPIQNEKSVTYFSLR